MKILKYIIPAVVLKKIYLKKSEPTSDIEKDAVTDAKDDRL